MLTKMVRPHIEVVTNVAPAHLLQHFESVEAIAQRRQRSFLGFLLMGLLSYLVIIPNGLF